MGPSGVTIRFIDRGRFFVGVLVRNGSSHPLTVVNAHVAEPPHSLVHQVGTRLGLVPPCNAHGLCGSGPTGADAARLRPVALAPGAEVDVQINYQLGSCAEVPHSSLATARVIELSYKDSQGVLQQQTLPIGGGLLHLQKPAGVECVPRPYSHIGLVGSFTTSPGHKPAAGQRRRHLHQERDRATRLPKPALLLTGRESSSVSRSRSRASWAKVCTGHRAVIRALGLRM